MERFPLSLSVCEVAYCFVVYVTIAGYLKGFCVICALKELIDALLVSETGVVSPWKFVNNLSCIL